VIAPRRWRRRTLRGSGSGGAFVAMPPPLGRASGRRCDRGVLAVCSRRGVAVARGPAVPVETQRRGVITQLTARRLQNSLGECCTASRACMSIPAVRMAPMFTSAAHAPACRR
jgi:hypothetical protein